MARILIVDDELDTVAIFSAAVRLLGHEPLGAASGMEALSRIDQDPPDLVLLDYMMPDLDGFETLRRIRSAPGGAEVPVVLVTASADETLGEKIRFLGGNGAVQKPLELNKLKALLREHLPVSEEALLERKFGT